MNNRTLLNKPVLTLFILTIIGLVFVAGCGQKKDPAQNSGQTAAGQNQLKELKKFRVGYLPTPGHVLYFVAQEKGYFAEEGLDVELFQFTNSGEGLNAVKAGKIDAGSFGTAAPLAFIAKGADFTIFGGQQTEGHGLIAKPEKAEQFRDLKNYKGKTIATVRLATGDVVFRGALLDAGINWKKDLSIKELDSPAAVLEAVKKGSVDAGIVWTPFTEMAKSQGLTVVKYSGELLKLHTCCRQVALTEKIKENPKDYESFMAALIKAYKFYQANQDETVDIIAKYVKIDKGLIKAETYGGHIFSTPAPDEAGVVKFWEIMNKAGYVSSNLKIEGHINTEIYGNALQRLVNQFPEDRVYAKLAAEFKK